MAEHSFGTSTTSPPRFNLLRIEEELSAAHLRLSRTVIEHMDWQQCIERYDRPHTLFYCDPPYRVRKAMVWIFLKGTTRGWQSWPGASEENDNFGERYPTDARGVHWTEHTDSEHQLQSGGEIYAAP